MPAPRGSTASRQVWAQRSREAVHHYAEGGTAVRPHSAMERCSLARRRAAWLAAPIISSPVSSMWQSFLQHSRQQRGGWGEGFAGQ